MAGIALVTGGGSGIGRACAKALHADGWQVIITGRNESRLLTTRDEIGAGVDPIPCDATDERAVGLLFELIAARYQRLDFLFNNAGVFPSPARIDDIALPDWKQCLEINLTGYFLMSRRAFRMMKDQRPQGGRILNNGSISAQTPRPQSAAYATAKHGVTGLTRAIAIDGRPFSIACGQIDIGNSATEMTEGFGTGMLQADGTTKPEPVFDAAHVGRFAAALAALPLDVNVPLMTVVATKMPFGGRG